MLTPPPPPPPPPPPLLYARLLAVAALHLPLSISTDITPSLLHLLSSPPLSRICRRRHCACTGGGSAASSPRLALPEQLPEATTVATSSPDSRKEKSRLSSWLWCRKINSIHSLP
ncbi:zinc finger homeobox protein 3-like [Salvia splendens]|uniref:zinc finger homeobox protein 3-like n=1 Tax=Salvia splendens TaxID=180675 RepID=UPI001C26148E|nr:zinc finger homeobox protein 3-like [Salvia splendens]